MILHSSSYDRASMEGHNTRATVRHRCGVPAVSLRRRLPAVEVNGEAEVMDVLAEIEEDARLNDDAIEIDSDEEYNG